MLSLKGEELFYKHLYLVEIYSFKLARYRGEQEDLYQQGAIGLLEAIKRFDATKGEFIGYAVKYITGYMKKDMYYKRVATVPLEDEETFSMVETNAVCYEQKEELYQHIQKLNNRQRIVVKLFLEDRSITEIAKTLNCSRQYVYKSFNQAIRELKGMMM